jgi:hypothetical protein
VKKKNNNMAKKQSTKTTKTAKKVSTKAVLATDPTLERDVVFIQYDIPPLKAGEYTVTLEQDVNLNTGAPYTVTRRFAVTGERFSLNADDVNSVFPPNLANGEFAGVFPHVVFNRRTLPWERTSVISEQSAPWLAVLLFNADEVPPVQALTAKALVPVGTTITVEGSSITGTGTMPANYFASPGMNNLDYGETPDDPANMIDIPAALFNAIVPSEQDLLYLAHIRDTETIDKTDNKVLDQSQYAVVLGNRIPKDAGATSYAFLVSLENFDNYLPNSDGTGNLPVNTQQVRLICYANWSFTVNDGDQTFKSLLENLNKDENGNLGYTSMQFPFTGPAPTSTTVQAALISQANNTLTADQAQTLVQNGFMMGYTPYTHILRHVGNTVSWFRGPLSPYAVTEYITVPISAPDAANRYNPETGLFDVSYGAAWQLGLLLALQNSGFASALYNWKKSESASAVVMAEQQIINTKYHELMALEGIMQARQTLLQSNADAPPPTFITEWLGKLALLNGVPFNYLVPDERMLPPESLRFFYLDNNWIDCLLDGAFSIGRSTTAEAKKDVAYSAKLMPHAKRSAKLLRPRKASLMTAENPNNVITGFLLRSAVAGGWPGLEVNGYSDLEGNNEIPKLRFEHLSTEVMICLFDGEVQMIAIHEPPEALHCGVESGPEGALSTTLRAVTGNQPGSQIPGAAATITPRADNQTIRVANSATTILYTLTHPPINEVIPAFTSAEYALEMVKGVVKVDFQKQ